MHGQVTIGGVELSDINKDSLMENITYIGHQSYLFKGTVRDNLIMGCSGADDAKLWEALERVNLSSFLKNENGLDTMLTERAANLSGGQRQRLALARALLHDAPFMLLDEPTSNLDSLNEAVILKSLSEERQDKTVVLVSHRKSTMGVADKIYEI